MEVRQVKANTVAANISKVVGFILLNKLICIIVYMFKYNIYINIGINNKCFTFIILIF